MTNCSVCKNLTKEVFEKKNLHFYFKKRCLVFSSNTLLTIKTYRDSLCYYSQREQICSICMIKNEFYSVEYDLYENMFNFDFLNRIHLKLFPFFARNYCFQPVCLFNPES